MLLGPLLGSPLTCPAQALRDLPLPCPGRAVQLASTDPSGGNLDHGHFVAIAPDGARVLADLRGPGRMTRLWSANPLGELRVLVDGREHWRGAFAERLAAAGPLGGAGTGGGLLSYVPIPFATSLRVELRGDGLDAVYWQLGAELGPGPLPDAAGLLDRGVPSEALRQVELADVVAHPGPGALLARLDGAAELCELAVRPRGPAGFDRVARRGVWLECRVDGEPAPCLAGPLGDVLGVGPDGDGVETLPVHSRGGWRVLRLPMPCHSALELTLVALDRASERSFDVRYGWRPLPAEHPRGALCGSFHRAVNRPGVPFDVLRVDGARGHVVGAFLTLAGAPGQGLTFLEGDETLRVDGETDAAIVGTGTEDDIGGAWYFRGGPFGGPFHAVATVDEARALVAAARFRIADPVAFTHGVHWSIEHGGGNDAPGSDYAAMAFWYRTAGRAPAPPDVTARRRWAAPQRNAQPVTIAATALWPQLATPGAPAIVELAAGRTALRLPAEPAWRALRGAPVRLRLDGPAGEAAAVVAALGEHVEITVAGGGLPVARVTAEPWLPAIRSWRIVGPFRPAVPRRGVDEAFGPERDADVAREYPITGPGPRGWRAPPAPPGWTGYLDLNAPFDPADDVVAYALCLVRSPVDQDATLVLGSDDAVKVFLAGREVHRHDGLRGAARDQDRVRVRLTAGEQPLLFKVEDYLGGFGLYARFEDARGLTFASGLP